MADWARGELRRRLAAREPGRTAGTCCFYRIQGGVSGGVLEVGLGVLLLVHIFAVLHMIALESLFWLTLGWHVGYVDALMNATSPSDSYVYYLPLGQNFPGGARPT